MQLHSHLKLHFEYDLHRLETGFYHPRHREHRNRGHSREDAAEKNAMHDTSERVALGVGGRDKDGKINAMMDEEDMERRSSSSSSSSSSGSGSGSSKSHEDEDAVDISSMWSSSADGTNRNITWASEVLEAVRSINEGRATFKEAQTRFEMFAKAGNRLTKISQ